MAIFKSSLIEITGLTADNTWRSVSLSGGSYQIPSTATGVILVIRNTDTTNSVNFGLRKPGSTDDFVAPIVPKAQYTAFVGCVNSVIQYRLQTSAVKLYLFGHFGPETEFFANQIKISHSLNLSWETVNLSSYVSNDALFGIFEIIDNGNERDFGLQPNGAQVHNAFGVIRHHTWAICPLDDNKRIALYAHTTDHSVYLVGYINTGKRELYPQGLYYSTVNQWEDVDLTNEGPPPFKTGAIFDVIWNPSEDNTNRKFLMRPNGATYDWDDYSELRGHCWFAVPIDSGDIFEAKRNDSKQYYLLQGFLDDPLYASPFVAETSIVGWVLGTQIQAPFVATVSGTGSVGYIGLDIELPLNLSFDATVVENRLTLDDSRFDINLNTLVGEIGTLDIVTPLPVLNFTTPAILEIELSPPALNVYAQVGRVASFNIVLDGAFQIVFGALTGNVGSIALRKIQPQLYLAPKVHQKAFLDLILYYPSLFLTGKRGELGELDIIFKNSIKLNLHSLHHILGNINIILDRFPIYLTVDQYLIEYIRTLVMNMSHYGVSEYLDYDFNAYAYFNSHWIGSKSDGIYALDGERDNGERPIQARMKIPLTDKDMKMLKRLREIWLTGRFENTMTCVIEGDEKSWWSDRFDRYGDGYLQEMRCKIAKGLKNRYNSIELVNDGGGDFDIDTISVMADTIERRVR